MDWLRDLDWASVATATIAASTLATGVATWLVLWFRRSDKPEPDWIAHGAAQLVPENDERGSVSGRLTNAGDGRAFRVTVDGSGCQAALFEDQDPAERRLFRPRTVLGFVPLIEPGQDVELNIGAESAAWEMAAVVVEWTASPTRKGKRRSLRVPLADIADRPEPSAPAT